MFLRAGQIGILDARRAEVLDNAAKCIQRRLRTYHARRDFLLMRSTAIALQAYCRGHCSCFHFPIYLFYGGHMIGWASLPYSYVCDS